MLFNYTLIRSIIVLVPRQSDVLGSPSLLGHLSEKGYEQNEQNPNILLRT